MSRLAFFVAITMVPALALAHDYPTTGRVEFVLECMNKRPGKHEYLYKCSCVIDAIAKELSYDDYLAASTMSRHQNLAGERGGMFRDPENVRETAKKYKALQTSAEKQCNF